MPFIKNVILGKPLLRERWLLYNRARWSQTDQTGITDNLGYPLLGAACYVSRGTVANSRRTLNHYTNGESAGKILDGGVLWASERAALNDGAEGDFARDHLQRIIRMRAGTLPYVDEAIRALDTIDFTNLFVSSFSYGGNELSLWKHYSDLYGASLGFPVEILEAGIRGIPGARIEDVIYDGKQQFNILEPLALQVVDALKSGLSPGRMVEFIDNGFGNAFKLVAPTIKNPDWEDEREVRVLLLNPPPHLIRTRSGKDGLVRYIQIDFRAAYDHADAVDLHFDTSFVAPGDRGPDRMEHLVRRFMSNGFKFGSISIPSAKLKW